MGKRIKKKNYAILLRKKKFHRDKEKYKLDYEKYIKRVKDCKKYTKSLEYLLSFDNENGKYWKFSVTI